MICTTDTIEYMKDNHFEIPYETTQEKLENNMQQLIKNINDVTKYGNNATIIGN